MNDFGLDLDDLVHAKRKFEMKAWLSRFDITTKPNDHRLFIGLDGVVRSKESDHQNYGAQKWKKRLFIFLKGLLELIELVVNIGLCPLFIVPPNC